MMNERILSPQLLKLVQAAGPGYSQANPEWVKKFAELIVTECARFVFKADQVDLALKLLDNFEVVLIKEIGVEE